MKRTKIPIRFALAFSMFLLTVLLFVDRAGISAAKSNISSELGFGMTDFGWIMAIFTLGYALFQAPAGSMADRYGTRSVIAGIIGIWSLLTAFTGIAWNYVSMMIIRFLFGAGEAGAYPALSQVVYQWFPLSERGTIQGINFSGSRIGAAFAMPLVGWLITEVGWRNTFFAFGVFGCLFALIWYLLFRDKPERAGFIGTAEVDFIIRNRQQSSSMQKPSLPFQVIMRSTAMWKLMIQYICSNFTFYFSLTWMYSYIQQRFQLGVIETGFYTSVPLIAGAAGNLIAGVMVDAIYRGGKWRRSRSVPAIIGFALSALGMIMVVQVSSFPLSILFMSLAILGADMTLSPSWAFCIDIGKENSGIVSGTMNMAGNLGAFVTIIAFPYLFQWTNRYEPFFMICAALSLLAIVIWISMNPENTFIHESKTINKPAMKPTIILPVLFTLCFFATTVTTNGQAQSRSQTVVSIRGDKFLINGKLTYKGRSWQGYPIEGLLMNSRMVQGIFDDQNPATIDQWKYPDTQKWDPDRNTSEFIKAMDEWYARGLLAFTLNMQGGSPVGYGNKGWRNSAIDSTGELRPAYMARLEKILNHARDKGMVVILGIYYFGQDQFLQNEAAVVKGVDNTVDWILSKNYQNILIEVNNECNVSYHHEILKPDRVHELITRVKLKTRNGYRLLAGTSYGGRFIPLENVVGVSDFILIHANGVKDPAQITSMVKQTRAVKGFKPMPVLFNEDDHFDFDKPSNNFVEAVKAYASWGYFDYRMKDEGFNDGYQSIPVNWGISSPRKKAFFDKLEEITGGLKN